MTTAALAGGSWGFTSAAAGASGPAGFGPASTAAGGSLPATGGRSGWGASAPAPATMFNLKVWNSSCPVASLTVMMTSVWVSAASGGTCQLSIPLASMRIPLGPDSTLYLTPPLFDFTTSWYWKSWPLRAVDGGCEVTTRQSMSDFSIA